MITPGGSDVPTTPRSRVRDRGLVEREPALRPVNDASRPAWACPWLYTFCKERRATRAVTSTGRYYRPACVRQLAEAAAGRLGPLSLLIRTRSSSAGRRRTSRKKGRDDAVFEGDDPADAASRNARGERPRREEPSNNASSGLPGGLADPGDRQSFC